MKSFSSVVVALPLMSAMLIPALAKDNEPYKRLREATAVLTEVMSAPDKGIPEDMLSNAHCIVIVPAMKTAAFIVGEVWQGVHVVSEQEWGWVDGARNGAD